MDSTSNHTWSTLTPYFVPPLAASGSIIPVFYGFIAKSARQTDMPIPRMSMIELLKCSCKAAPTVGVTVGTQIVVQGLVEKTLLKRSDHEKNSKPSFTSMLTSSIVVGIVSIPALAVFNAQTMRQPVLQSLRSISVKQSGAILVRETSFLFSIRVSGPLGVLMKEKFDQTETVEYTSAFLSGAIGSLVGHPADTALTLWQRGKKIINLSQLTKGGGIKALAVGGFSVCYKKINDFLNS